jgi:hypothetical protein
VVADASGDRRGLVGLVVDLADQVAVGHVVVLDAVLRQAGTADRR